MVLAELISGGMAGLVATVPMTAALQAMHRTLPDDERYPLPPEEVSIKLLEEGMLKRHLGTQEHLILTTLSHFAYGATSGAAYALLAKKLADKLPLSPALRGILFGVGLWAGSYLGWLPAFGVITPATQHPPRRTALMIAGHIIWGAATGVLTEEWEPQ